MGELTHERHPRRSFERMSVREVGERWKEWAMKGEWERVEKAVGVGGEEMGGRRKKEEGMIEAIKSVWREWRDEVTKTRGEGDEEEGGTFPQKTALKQQQDSFVPSHDQPSDSDDDSSDSEESSEDEESRRRGYIYDVFGTQEGAEEGGGDDKPPRAYFYHSPASNKILSKVLKLLQILWELVKRGRGACPAPEFEALSAIALSCEMLTRGWYEDLEFEGVSGLVLISSAKLIKRYNQRVNVAAIVDYTAVKTIGMIGDLNSALEGYKRLLRRRVKSVAKGRDVEMWRREIKRYMDDTYEKADR